MKFYKKSLISSGIVAVAAAAGCGTMNQQRDASHRDGGSRDVAAASGVTAGKWLEDAHRTYQPSKAEDAAIRDTLTTFLSKHKVSKENLPVAVDHLAKYLELLGIPHEHVLKAPTVTNTHAAAVMASPHKGPTKSDGSKDQADENDDDSGSALEKVLPRLLQSSLEFLGCDLSKPESPECVEATPKLTPSAKYRQEDEGANLGDAVRAGPRLDIEGPFFTKGWDTVNKPPLSVAHELATRIQDSRVEKLSMALYGIEDGKGTMHEVWDAITNKIKNDRTHKNVRVVFDIAAFDKLPSGQSPTYSLLDHSKDKYWVFQPSLTENLKQFNTIANFQYPESVEMLPGTQALIKMLNQDTSGNYFTDLNNMMARLEWPIGHIMHNKFLVLEGSGMPTAGVWTGTTNLSNHCMGGETNSNMAIYIKNAAIAKAYATEFNHMWCYGGDVTCKTAPQTGQNEEWGGLFHNTKHPVSNRLFKFDDGTYVTLHFAPTDDGEHRAILPMLYSAQQGDEIRIAMFGNSGFEIVRAIQYAIAEGANVTIVLDRQQGAGNFSWINAKSANIFEKETNPFKSSANPGRLTVYENTFDGKNHYKAGSLTRAGKAIEIILGSQNWSAGGNDGNDENLVAIMNVTAGVPAGQAFNKEFDTHILPLARGAKALFKQVTSSKN